MLLKQSKKNSIRGISWRNISQHLCSIVWPCWSAKHRLPFTRGIILKSYKNEKSVLFKLRCSIMMKFLYYTLKDILWQCTCPLIAFYLASLYRGGGGRGSAWSPTVLSLKRYNTNKTFLLRDYERRTDSHVSALELLAIHNAIWEAALVWSSTVWWGRGRALHGALCMVRVGAWAPV